jgi:hypothetical protein
MKLTDIRFICAVGIILAIVCTGIFVVKEDDMNVNSIEVQVSNQESNTIKLLEEHKDILVFLEENIYPIRKELSITLEKGELNVSGKVSKAEIDQIMEHKIMLKSVFEELNCANIHLYTEEEGLFLSILLDNRIEINKNTIAEQIVTYCEEGGYENAENIFGDWYYEVLFYT